MTIAGYILLAIWVYVGIYALVDRVCKAYEKGQLFKAFASLVTKDHVGGSDLSDLAEKFHRTNAMATENMKKILEDAYNGGGR